MFELRNGEQVQVVYRRNMADSKFPLAALNDSKDVFALDGCWYPEGGTSDYDVVQYKGKLKQHKLLSLLEQFNHEEKDNKIVLNIKRKDAQQFFKIVLGIL